MARDDEAAATGPKPSEREIDAFKRRLFDHLTHTVGKDTVTTTARDWYHALARTVRDQLVESWMDSTRATYRSDAKRVYYLSLEFLIGRSLSNNLFATGFYDICRATLADMKLDFDNIADQEPEAALGNGGLGRLAACLVDSMASIGVPAYGYGIRYDYGMFSQYIEDGRQVEMPENWLSFGNHWEFARPEVQYPIKFYGRVNQWTDDAGRLRHEWLDAEEVNAIAYDQPIPGFGAWTVNNIRLWRARSSRAFDLKRFNQGDYIDSVRNQSESESLSRILYPDDSSFAGKELRLKQEYFFVSASLQDIVRRHLSQHKGFGKFSDKVAIQLNDTHPAIAVPELMRLLMDVHGLGWDEAWKVCRHTFAYTNHTLMPEALETWPVHMFERMLPRHLDIIYEINRRFIEEVRARFPDDEDRVRRLSLIDENGGRRIRMAHVAFVGSHRVNGVARIHTELMKTSVFADFHQLWPDRIVNKTNGITPRRWLNQANPGLSKLITRHIGDGWIGDLERLRELVPLAEDTGFQDEFREVKHANKKRLARLIKDRIGVTVDDHALFDVQVKRIHEYKRQLLNILQVVARYNRIRMNPGSITVPRTVIFAGKAAPGYYMARLIIKLINDVGAVVNNDPASRDLLKVVFFPNYNVSNAEIIIPAANLSEQISTAGTEASGTGNMKFALNGALTIGTRDGANIEIGEEVEEDNIFFFGLNPDEAKAVWAHRSHDPWAFYHANPELREVLDMVGGGYFSPGDPERFRPIVDSLTVHGDHYLLLADFAAYMAAQDRVDAAFHSRAKWAAKAIYNVARMGKFSSDLTVLDYANEIWKVRPKAPGAENMVR